MDNEGVMHAGPYTLLRSIARGGMGSIHIAVTTGPARPDLASGESTALTHRGLPAREVPAGPPGDDLVAVKRLRPEHAQDPLHRRMFLEEARVGAWLNHPNLVQTFGVIDSPEGLFIAMEYVEGTTLRALARRPDFRPRHGIAIVLGALAGLHAAHEATDDTGAPAHLVHRDFSPENLMVSLTGEAKLLDFGIAKGDGSPDLTETGMIKGKGAYMTPEQVRGDPVDRRMDVYAAGVVLWEVLAQRRMWGDDVSFVDKLRKIARGEIPQLPASANVHPALVRVCATALQGEPVRRYPTAFAFRRDLLRAAHEAGELATADELAALVHATAGAQIAERRAHVSAVRAESTRPPPPPRPSAAPSRGHLSARGKAVAALVLAGFAVLGVVTALVVRPLAESLHQAPAVAPAGAEGTSPTVRSAGGDTADREGAASPHGSSRHAP